MSCYTDSLWMFKDKIKTELGYLDQSWNTQKKTSLMITTQVNHFQEWQSPLFITSHTHFSWSSVLQQRMHHCSLTRFCEKLQTLEIALEEQFCFHSPGPKRKLTWRNIEWNHLLSWCLRSEASMQRTALESLPQTQEYRSSPPDFRLLSWRLGFSRQPAPPCDKKLNHYAMRCPSANGFWLRSQHRGLYLQFCDLQLVNGSKPQS